MTFQLNSELQAVNAILGAIGQAPVQNLNTTANPEVQLALDLLRQTSVDVQDQGWVFNREDHLRTIPNTNGQIVIPANALQVDVSFGQIWRMTNVVIRNGLLYDKIRHTDNFSDWLPDGILLDYTWLWDFDDLPGVFQRYITLKASERAATQMVSNADLARLLQQQSEMARAACLEYECNQGDYSYMGWPETTAYRPYQPWQTLIR
mgnify:FL=1|jgi:hypothetical protein|tara:strand:- start:182 stop:799 length:618 start_codon:yes stop_codon:yes gene_type:complete